VAKFEDYAKSRQDNAGQDNLEQEINEAAQQSDDRRSEAGSFELPERFKGKTAEEIARSYVELETLNSRQAQNLGQMRKTVDELLALQLQNGPQTRQEKPDTKPVTVDDLYERPDEAIRTVAREETDTRVQKLEKELQQERFERAKKAFSEQFPKWEDDVHNPDFISWIHTKPYRVALARRADSGDWSAAEELFGTYYDHLEVSSKKKQKEERKQKIKEVSLESPGAEVPEQVETFSRSALLEKRLAAKRGDRNADFWLRTNAERIAIAYEEGRIVD
jgi:hypothetical protein